jgi:hypothetical protein
MDVATHPHNNSLVVLIHGVMSNRYLAWKGVIDLIQNIHRGSSSMLRSYDYHSFEYESGLLLQPQLSGCFDRLRELIARPRYDTVVLIGHSQGGVAAKLFVIEELLKGRGKELKVDIVITLDTPHRGPQPWIYPVVVAGGIWKRLPLLESIPIFRQTAELGFASKQLKKLKQHWTETLIAQTPIPPQAGRRFIRSYTFSGTRLPFPPVKMVVSKRSANGFKIDQPTHDLLPPDWSLGHGVVALQGYQPHLEAILTEHDAAAALKHSDAAAATLEASLVAVLAQSQGSAPNACDVYCWKRRFVEGLPQRPIRKLSAAATLEKFVELRVLNP